MGNMYEKAWSGRVGDKDIIKRVKNDEFKCVDLFGFHRCWATILKRGWHAKFSKRDSWMRPPMGIFKLNFDGIFVKFINKVTKEV